MSILFRWFLFIFILIIQVNPLLAQQDRASLEQDKKKAEDGIRYTNKLLDQTRKSKKANMSEVVILADMIGKRQELITAINSEIHFLNVQISFTEDSIRELNTELTELRDEYARIIYFAYKNRDLYNRFMFIFAADDFNQAYQRLKYFQQYQVYRKKQAELIRQTQEKLHQKSESLSQRKAEKEQLAGTVENEKNKLFAEKEDKDRIVQKLVKTEKDLKKELKQKEKAIRDLQKAIQKIIAAEIAARAKSVAGKPSELALTPEELELSGNFMSNKGKLPWPMERGIVSSTFGEHPHPVLKRVKVRNNGINILTNEGGEARAVFKGKVTRVMSVPNNNNVVIIRHGEYLTVYSNLDRVYVREGDAVDTKDKIGVVFTSPDESRTELHFEVWKAKTLLNPASWLAHE